MGGLGSGNRWHTGKPTTAGMLRLDVRWLHRQRYLDHGRSGTLKWSGGGSGSIRIACDGDNLILKYRTSSHDGEWHPMQYPVSLTWTGCTLGGRRPWFRCPAKGCGRRVAVLYGGRIFACRACHGVVYASQHEDSLSRAFSRADRIRARLKWQPGIAFMPGERPKGMHHLTYERLLRQYLTAAERANALTIERLRGLDAFLEERLQR